MASEKGEEMNDSPADDHTRSEEAGNSSRREQSGLISVNVDRKYYEMIVQIQGSLIRRFPKQKWTIKSSLEKSIDMIQASMLAFDKLKPLPDAEQQ